MNCAFAPTANLDRQTFLSKLHHMSPEDRKALGGIVVGVAWGGLTMAGPLAFPHAPIWVWRASFSLAAIIVLAGITVLAYDFFIRPRGKRLDPLIAIAIVSIFVALVSLGIYVARGPQFADRNVSDNPIEPRPELTLLPPSERHEIRWSPKVSNEIQIGPEGKIVDGSWFVPTFELRTITGTAAQDVSVRWQMDMVGIESVVKGSANLEGANFEFGKDTVQISGPSRSGDWRYVLSKAETVSFPFVTKAGVKAFFPVNIFSSVMLYTIALMPDRVGAQIDPLFFTVTVNWNLPQQGVERFSVVANISNAKAPGLSEPKVDALVSFQVKKL
jgi:hypothetical protein